MLEFAAMNEFQSSWILVWVYESLLFLWMCKPVLPPLKQWSVLQKIATVCMVLGYVLVKYKIESYIFINILWMVVWGGIYLILFSELPKTNAPWVAAVFAVCIELGRILVYGSIYISGHFDFYLRQNWPLRIIVQMLKLFFVNTCRKTVCEYARHQVHMMDYLLVFIAMYHLIFMHHRRLISSSAENRQFEIQTFLMLGAGVVMILYTMVFHIKNSMHQKHISEVEQAMKDSYAQTEMKMKMDKEIARIHHDLKHQLAAMDVSALASDSDGRKELANSLMKQVTDLEVVSGSGNALLDSLLTHLMKNARDKGISLELFLEKEDYGFLESIDMCSIFGNVLSNAIEAAEKLPDADYKWIRVKSAVIQGIWILKAENLFSEAPLMENGDYISSKAGPKRTGIGISSVRYCAEKYGGKTEIYTGNNVFTIKVMIPVLDSK